MPVTKYAIVYSTKSKIIRRTISLDKELDDSHFQHHHVANGETMMFVPIKPDGSTIHFHKDWEDLIEKETGTRPPNAHCSIVETLGNTVVDLASADPDLDIHPKGKLILTKGRHVHLGHVYDFEKDQFHDPKTGEIVK